MRNSSSQLNKKSIHVPLEKKNSTTCVMINSASSTRYSWPKETKNMLEYIHGGLAGAFFAAWDFLRKNSTHDQIEKFIVDFNKGKFMEKLHGKFNKEFNKSENGVNQAVAAKYKLFLSRRTFSFLCKVQAQTFYPEEQKWNRKVVSYGDRKINLENTPISNGKVEQFVKGLDIGDLHTITGYCGVFRTITALTIMIIDLHL